MIGFITGEIPDVTYVLPHDEEYQYQFAPVPKEPPETLRVEASPEQIIEGEA